MDTPRVHPPEHWHRRAEELRTLAAMGKPSSDARSLLMQIANECQRDRSDKLLSEVLRATRDLIGANEAAARAESELVVVRIQAEGERTAGMRAEAELATTRARGSWWRRLTGRQFRVFRPTASTDVRGLATSTRFGARTAAARRPWAYLLD
jgi:hypothetical protein